MVGSSPLRLGLVLRPGWAGAARGSHLRWDGRGSCRSGAASSAGAAGSCCSWTSATGWGLLELLRVELRHRALRQQVPDLAEQGVQVLLGLHGLFLRRGLLNGRLLRAAG